jgi:hypothetical protein
MKSYLTLPGRGHDVRRLRIAMAAVTAWCAAVVPAAMAQSTPPTLTNAYSLAGRVNPPVDTWLSSYVSCGLLRCDIGYRVHSLPIDRFVKVQWQDSAGQPLVSASNFGLSSFYDRLDGDGYLEATEWSKGVLLGGPQASMTIGTADFSGTGAGVQPCSAGFVCNDAEYYYWPSMWGSSSPGGPGRPQGLRQTAPTEVAAPVTLGSITGTLSNVGVLADQPADITGPRVVFLEFSSSVDWDTDHYIYRYSISNSTDLSIPFEWHEAGMGETIGAFSTLQREFTSQAAPGVLTSLPSWTLSTDSQFPVSIDFANSLEIFAPVPEPGQWLQLALGLAMLGAVRLRAATHDGAA